MAAAGRFRFKELHYVNRALCAALRLKTCHSLLTSLLFLLKDKRRKHFETLASGTAEFQHPALQLTLPP